MTSTPTGTITFLFTDIEGSTKLWERHPTEMRLAVARHDVLLQTAVAEHGGYLFKTTGDGIAAAFATAAQGTAAALAAQLGLSTEAWPEPILLRSRMALHVGAAELRDGDYFGPSLNRCARLMAAGHGGQVLLSDAAQELSRDALPPDTTLRALGEHRLKDLTRPETVYQLLHPALGESFPPLQTLDNPDLPNNLPQQLTSFIGRETAISDVRAMLAKGRLLTLTGSGGGGKTRLALQVAADVLDDYPDGVWLVELASLSDPDLVVQEVAAILGVQDDTRQKLEQKLIESLQKKRVLLLLDNCEHLLSACAQLTGILLRSCPRLKVLATSREAMGIGGEVTYRIASLTLPDAKSAIEATAASLGQYESVRLFIARAQAVKAEFTVTNQNAPALAQLCYRLDGIPLALELAAARTRSLTVEDINSRLDSRFRLLSSGDRSVLPRQQTLRALIDWSYDMLSGAEKMLLARLSVFAGGWTLPAAETVCGSAPIESWEVLDLLTSLVDKSLVLTVEDTSLGSTRYQMLESLRQYATEKLDSSDEAAGVHARHQEWCVALAEEARSQLDGPEQVSWLTRLDVEHDNLRAALARNAAIPDADVNESGQSALRLLNALLKFWMVRGYFGEAREQIYRGLNKARTRTHPSPTELAEVLSLAGWLDFQLRDYAGARLELEESVSLYHELRDQPGSAGALLLLGYVAHAQGENAEARSLQEQSLAIHRDLANMPDIVRTLNNLSQIVSDQGDYNAARALCQESLGICRELGDKRGIASSLMNLSRIAAQQGDFAEVRSLQEESLRLAREMGDKRGIGFRLHILANLARREGDYDTARPFNEESLAIFRELQDKRFIACSNGHGRRLLRPGRIWRGAITAGRRSWALPRCRRYGGHRPVDLFPRNCLPRRTEILRSRCLLGVRRFNHGKSRPHGSAV